MRYKKGTGCFFTLIRKKQPVPFFAIISNYKFETYISPNLEAQFHSTDNIGSDVILSSREIIAGEEEAGQ